jgi:outer membrane murein-binding lipoprotein Lpp
VRWCGGGGGGGGGGGFVSDNKKHRNEIKGGRFKERMNTNNNNNDKNNTNNNTNNNTKNNTNNDGILELARDARQIFSTTKPRDLLLFNTSENNSLLMGNGATATYLDLGASTIRAYINSIPIFALDQDGMNLCEGTMNVCDLRIKHTPIEDIIQTRIDQLNSAVSASIQTHRKDMEFAMERMDDVSQGKMRALSSLMGSLEADVRVHMAKTQRSLELVLKGRIDDLRSEFSQSIASTRNDMRELRESIVAETDRHSARLENMREDVMCVCKSQIQSESKRLQLHLSAMVTEKHDEMMRSTTRTLTKEIHEHLQTLGSVLRDAKEKSVLDQAIFAQNAMTEMKESLSREMDKQIKHEYLRMTDMVHAKVDALLLSNSLPDPPPHPYRDDPNILENIVQKAILSNLSNLSNLSHFPNDGQCGTSIWRALSNAIEYGQTTKAQVEHVHHQIMNMSMNNVNHVNNVNNLNNMNNITTNIHTLNSNIQALDHRVLALQGDVYASQSNVQHALTTSTWTSNTTASFVSYSRHLQNQCTHIMGVAEWCSNVYASSLPPRFSASNEYLSKCMHLQMPIKESGQSNLYMVYHNAEEAKVLAIKDDLYYPPFAIIPPLVESYSKNGLGLWSRYRKGMIAFYTGSDRAGLPIERMVLTETGMKVAGIGDMKTIHEDGVSLKDKYVTKDVFEKLIHALVVRGLVEEDGGHHNHTITPQNQNKNAIVSRLSYPTLFNENNRTVDRRR